MTAIQDEIGEMRGAGYSVLRAHFTPHLIDACREACSPLFLAYLKRHGSRPNRGPYRHFLPMSFDPPCFAPLFFFDDTILRIVRGVMDDRVVADQWGCDLALPGSEYQAFHLDYRRPLFAEEPGLILPAHALIVSFALARVTRENGPLEVVPGSHRVPREEALRAVDAGGAPVQAVPLDIGDVLIRNPWVLHRGTPNTSGAPRPLVSIRYVRRWYTDDSREVDRLPRSVWQALTPAQQSLMRFPVGDR